ncbi:serine/threonine-protein kinase Wnk [Cylas formicarius]|uniref:serine/threonine-protein kinase Wnk n=1 Tax=Cylas formicarius TaxID=197179 RepID=UPI002958B785|nr:serine/threonine-protein kinase Wnk [Cylas formicarius]
MEKEQHAESMATVNIKPDYPPSEYCSSEPPPAYHKSQSSAVQVAKIIAVTVVLVSFVLGSFLLASAYVQASASCRQLEQDLELLSEVADKFDNQQPLQPQALIQDEPKHAKRESQSTAESQTKDIDDNSIDSDSTESDSTSVSDEDSKEPIRFKLPLQLDFDDLAGAMIAKNQKSKMNCIVEKKKAEEVVDHQPKTVRLPFGVNLTTDPRYERLTGERMVIICESGNMLSAQPQQPEKHQTEDEEDDNEPDTIMIQPVMIPIPHTAFQTHMPQQAQPSYQQQPLPPQMRPLHPMETLRPPMPPVRQAMEPMRPQMEPMRPPFEQMRPQIIAVRQFEGPMRPMNSQRESFDQEPPRVVAIPFRPPMLPEKQQAAPERPQIMAIPQEVQIRVQAQTQSQQGDVPPNPIIHHIIQQIIAQKIAESQRAEQDNQVQESREDDYEPQPQREVPENMMAHRIPIPEEILTQLNRLPNNDRVIVAVSENDSSEDDSSSSSSSSDDSSQDSQEMQLVQEPRQTASEMNGRQAYARRLPVSIPVNMMQQQMHEQDQEPQAVASEDVRPHYVQPRSIPADDGQAKSRVARSVNPLVPEKRVKRCSCDCAC